MTKFDKLLMEYDKKSRTIKRTERYPKGIDLSRDFIEYLEEEYFSQYIGGNRNFHSNFLKAISFELDKFKDNPELIAKHINPEIDLEDVVDTGPVVVEVEAEV